RGNLLHLVAKALSFMRLLALNQPTQRCDNERNGQGAIKWPTESVEVQVFPHQLFKDESVLRVVSFAARTATSQAACHRFAPKASNTFLPSCPISASHSFVVASPTAFIIICACTACEYATP